MSNFSRGSTFEVRNDNNDVVQSLVITHRWLDLDTNKVRFEFVLIEHENGNAWETEFKDQTLLNLNTFIKAYNLKFVGYTQL